VVRSHSFSVRPASRECPLAVKGAKREKTRYARYARATFRKDRRRLNICISSKDLEAIQKRALEEVLLYQNCFVFAFLNVEAVRPSTSVLSDDRSLLPAEDSRIGSRTFVRTNG
jgi:predicted DNA binding CopG/RHH family protein